MTESDSTQAVVVFCTAPSPDEARRIARALLEAKLVACVNIAGGVESHYWWQGAIEQADELLLVIKTTRAQFEAVRRAIVEQHSYDVPEIIALPVLAGHAPYLQWIRDSVAGGGGQ